MSADLHADVTCAGPLDTDGEAPVAPRFSDVDWLRPRDMKDDNKVPLGERAHLFIDDAEQPPLSPVAPDDGVVVEQLDELAGACPTDVVPSTVLDDRWLLSALAMTARNPERLKKLFVCTKYGAKYGLYVIQFFKDGEWVPVIVDDKIPCWKSGPLEGRPIFARCRNPMEYWVCIVEKAYAKLHGCYQALEHGRVDHALRDFTGGDPHNVQLKEIRGLVQNVTLEEAEGEDEVMKPSAYIMDTQAVMELGYAMAIGVHKEGTQLIAGASVSSIAFETGDEWVDGLSTVVQFTVEFPETIQTNALNSASELKTHLERLKTKVEEAKQLIKADDIAKFRLKEAGEVRQDILWHRDGLFKKIMTNQSHTVLFGTMINDPQNQSGADAGEGLLSNHAYCVMDIINDDEIARQDFPLPEDAEDQKDVTLLKIRNPWEESEWQGAWSDNSDHWDRHEGRMKRIAGWENRHDGQFFMSSADFMKRFTTLYFCDIIPDQWAKARVVGEWKGESWGGCYSKYNNTGPDRWQQNPQFRLKVDNASAAHIVLAQEDARLKRGTAFQQYDHAIGFMIYKSLDGKAIVFI